MADTKWQYSPNYLWAKGMSRANPLILRRLTHGITLVSLR
jgi:hypothetical protein